jgi:hypothetical protein
MHAAFLASSKIDGRRIAVPRRAVHVQGKNLRITATTRKMPKQNA